MKKTILTASIIIGALAVLTAVALALTASSRVDNIGGTNVGSVIIGSEIPFRIRFPAGGLTPGERAEIVARRLSQIQTVSPNDVRVGIVNGQYAVLANNELVVTADSNHATANNTTPQQLALTWRNNLRDAVTLQAGGGGGTGGGTPPIGTGPAPVNTARKVVPILSVGEGTRVGLALVTGPSDRVDDVKAVAQIEGDFRANARVRALVPIDAESVVDIRRVPQTSVYAIGDIRL